MMLFGERIKDWKTFEWATFTILILVFFFGYLTFFIGIIISIGSIVSYIYLRKL
jgi:hypothetical protein